MGYYRYLRIILILIPVLLLTYLFYKDLNPSGQLKISYDFCSPTPFISEFSPHGRVLDIEKNKTTSSKEYYQKMVIDPVYFDVRLPQKFTTAQLTVWYQKKPATVLKIGPAVELSLWQWQLEDINFWHGDNGWSVGSADYDLTNLKLDNGRLRFLVSSPGLDKNNGEIIFKKIKIEFQKDPLSADNWPWRLKDWFKASRLCKIVMCNE